MTHADRAIVALVLAADLDAIDDRTLTLLEATLGRYDEAEALTVWEKLSRASKFRGSDVARLGTRWPDARVRQNAWIRGALPTDEAAAALVTEPSLRVRACIAAAHFLDPAAVTTAMVGLDTATARYILRSRELGVQYRPTVFPPTVWQQILDTVKNVNLSPDELNCLVSVVNGSAELAGHVAADPTALLALRVRAIGYPQVPADLVVDILTAVTAAHTRGLEDPSIANTALVNAQARKTLTEAEYEALAACARAVLSPRNRRSFVESLDKRRDGTPTDTPESRVRQCANEEQLYELVTSLKRNDLRTVKNRNAVLGTTHVSMRVVRAVAEISGTDLVAVIRALPTLRVVWEDFALAVTMLDELDTATRGRLLSSPTDVDRERFAAQVADGSLTLPARVWTMALPWPGTGLSGAVLRAPLPLALKASFPHRAMNMAALDHVSALVSEPTGEALLNQLTRAEYENDTLGDLMSTFAAATR